VVLQIPVWPPLAGQVDGSIQALVPATDLPAYPSEDAVVSGVTAELLETSLPDNGGADHDQGG
jgi:hypothetical protein